MTFTKTQPLTGDDLLSYVAAHKDETKSDQAVGAGYVRTNSNGDEAPAFTAFYEALLDAKGIPVPVSQPNPYEGQDIAALLLDKGFNQVNVSYDPNLYGFFIRDEAGDQLEDGDLEEFLDEELWEKLEDAVGNNIFNGVVNVSKQGLTFTGEVIQAVSHTDLPVVW